MVEHRAREYACVLYASLCRQAHGHGLSVGVPLERYFQLALDDGAAVALQLRRRARRRRWWGVERVRLHHGHVEQLAWGRNKRG